MEEKTPSPPRRKGRERRLVADRAHFTMYMERAMYTRLDEIAAVSGLSMAQIVRLAIPPFLDRLATNNGISAILKDILEAAEAEVA